MSYKKYMASLKIREKHFCCGFIISRRIVMSTGSCAYYMMSHGGPDYIDATVHIGNYDLRDTYSGKKVNVDHAMYHQDYVPEDPIGTSSYDIGYILLRKQLPKHDGLRMIRLSPNNIQYNKTYEMYGWGSDKFEDPKIELWNVLMSPNLKKLEIKITNRDVCQKLLGRDLRPNQICGVGIGEGETAAQGDAGSPLIRGYRFYGIASVVNIEGSQGAVVFIGAKPFTEYMNDLETRFPENKTCRFSGANKEKRKLRDFFGDPEVRTDRADALEKMFTFGRDTHGEKYGRCIKCEMLTGSEKIIKMTDSNTTGIKKHLKLYHSRLSKNIYSELCHSNTQGDAGSPLIRGYHFHGITSIVNINGTRSPIVFIEAKPFEEYINNLMASFPEDKKCGPSNTNKQRSESSSVSGNKKIRTDRAEEVARIFTYGRDTYGGKYGKCMECASSTGCERIIKMKNFNTSGVKRHLQIYHPELFKKIYREPTAPNTQVSSEQNDGGEC